MKIYVIKKIFLMGNTVPLEYAYPDKRVAELKIESLPSEGFLTYKLVETEGEEITNNRIIVDRTVYKIDNIDPEKAIIKHALAKLNTEEKRALGFNS